MNNKDIWITVTDMRGNAICLRYFEQQQSCKWAFLKRLPGSLTPTLPDESALPFSATLEHLSNKFKSEACKSAYGSLMPLAHTSSERFIHQIAMRLLAEREQTMKVVLRPTRSEQMALTDLVAASIRAGNIADYVDCSHDPPVTTTTAQLLALIIDGSEIEYERNLPFNEDMVRRTGLPRDVFLLLHDMAYHHDGRDLQNYITRAQQALKRHEHQFRDVGGRKECSCGAKE